MIEKDFMDKMEENVNEFYHPEIVDNQENRVDEEDYDEELDGEEE